MLGEKADSIGGSDSDGMFQEPLKDLKLCLLHFSPLDKEEPSFKDET